MFGNAALGEEAIFFPLLVLKNLNDLFGDRGFYSQALIEISFDLKTELERFISTLQYKCEACAYAHGWVNTCTTKWYAV